MPAENNGFSIGVLCVQNRSWDSCGSNGTHGWLKCNFSSGPHSTKSIMWKNAKWLKVVQEGVGRGAVMEEKNRETLSRIAL